MKSVYAILDVFVLLALLGSTAHGQVTEAWVARYDGPLANQGWGYDMAYDLAVDVQGNVYVTGESGGARVESSSRPDYATIKYDANGNQLWVSRYDQGWKDKAQSVAVDPEGNVYVTGMSYGISVASEYATVKYDSLGEQLWVAHYDEISQVPENRAGFVDLDSVGNVYVTGDNGRLELHGEDWDFVSYLVVTIKYDADGNEMWKAYYRTPDLDQVWVNDLVVDDAGNAYITGVSAEDYFTIKYDSDGMKLWKSSYDGPEHRTDEANDLALDAAGNVYVTGSSKKNFATIKYDSNGNQLWVTRYDHDGNFDEGKAIAVDAAGNVYVAGTSGTIGTIREFAIVKYDSSGNQLWDAQYHYAWVPGLYCRVSGLVLDSFANVYITGRMYAGEGYPYHDFDYFTLKYDTYGNQAWVVRYDGPVNGYDGANDISLDEMGNVYVTGLSGGNNNWDYATIKYVPSVEIAFSDTPDTVYPGQTVSWQYELSSNADTTQVFDCGLRIAGPQNKIYPLGQKMLGPHESESGALTLTVPSQALPGLYTVSGYVGSMSPLAIWDQDSFECEVVRALLAR